MGMASVQYHLKEYGQTTHGNDPTSSNDDLFDDSDDYDHMHQDTTTSGDDRTQDGTQDTTE